MLKRIFDVVASVLALLLFSPVMIIVGLSVALSFGLPILFLEKRPGLGARPFTICKFRTMTQRRSDSDALLPDEQRLTPFGRFLRASSLDELPELLNVLVGDMSLVGPRPLLVEYLPLYSDEQARRHEVRPGITGWAQVRGRNHLSWEDKFKLDVWYVENRTFWLDLRIILLTVVKVLKREGISHPGESTMPKFAGKTK